MEQNASKGTSEVAWLVSRLNLRLVKASLLLWLGGDPPRGRQRAGAGRERKTVSVVGDDNTATRAVGLKPLLSA